MLFGALGWVIADTTGATSFALCSLLAGAAVFTVGDRALLGTLRARPLAQAERPLLLTTVERLSASFGITPPRLHLIEDGFPRAFAAGRGPRSSALAVSTGLLDALPPAELEAVLAHELEHIRVRDVLPQTLVVVLSTTMLELTRMGGWLSRALLAVLAPIAAAFTHLVLSPRRELEADAAAAAVTDPDDLADALLRLDRAADLVDFAASPATAPLYAVSPFDDDDRVARMFETHPPLADRVALLRAERPQP